MFRGMAFIDGENLVCRYQDMLKSGFTPLNREGVVTHRQDIYVFNPRMFSYSHINILRATIYTSAVADEDKINEIKSQIQALSYDQYGEGGKSVFPFIVKKNKDGRQSKGVDIQLTVDLLSHSFRHNIEVAFIATGDADFIPAIEEAKRNGCQVYVAAFSSGLNQKLRHAADKFIDLDSFYFEPKSK